MNHLMNSVACVVDIFDDLQIPVHNDQIQLFVEKDFDVFSEDPLCVEQAQFPSIRREAVAQAVLSASIFDISLATSPPRISSSPPINGLNTSGIRTEPSGC